jgi:CRISPR-associated protein Cas2
MRLLVFFDLPTTTKDYKQAYIEFRRFLLQDGYNMLQWSVYGRVINGEDSAEKHFNRLSKNLPKKGSIRCMKVSEKQYAGMKILLGESTSQEKNGCQQLLLF